MQASTTSFTAHLISYFPQFLTFDCVQAAATAFAAAYPVHSAALRGDVNGLREIISRGTEVNQPLEQVIKSNFNLTNTKSIDLRLLSH